MAHTIRFSNPEELSRAKYDLEIFLLGGAFDLYEDGKLFGPVDEGQAAAEVSYEKLILSCWGEGWARSWRVIAHQPDSHWIRLVCLKKMGQERCSLELRRGGPEEGGELSRAEFAQNLPAWIEANLPGVQVVRAVAGRDDSLPLSGIHTRLVIRDHGKTAAGVAVGACESQAAVDALLAAGIIWVDALNRKDGDAKRLLLFAPRGRAATIATRLTLMNLSGIDISLYEVGEQEQMITRAAAFDQGDLVDHLKRNAARALWPRGTRIEPEVAALLHSVTSLAPDSVVVRGDGRWAVLSINGLEFARVSVKSGQVEFGVGNVRRKLTGHSHSALEKLVSEIVEYRRADSPHRNEYLFRADGERWLGAVLREEITKIDPSIDPRFVYSQVPAYRGDHRRFVDLLTATRDGRLVILELKVAEDPELPFQGLDYWMRVDWHRRRGDFERRGYFQGFTLSEAPPLLYLVAPLFRFHATTRLIAGAIRGDVPVYRVGINSDWRAGVKMLLTERLN